jgi:hypothetical protein
MDVIAFYLRTMLLVLMLLVGGILLLGAFRESLGVGMKASDFVYGVVVLAIWS